MGCSRKVHDQKIEKNLGAANRITFCGDCGERLEEKCSMHSCEYGDFCGFCAEPLTAKGREIFSERLLRQNYPQIVSLNALQKACAANKHSGNQIHDGRCRGCGASSGLLSNTATDEVVELRKSEAPQLRLACIEKKQHGARRDGVTVGPCVHCGGEITEDDLKIRGEWLAQEKKEREEKQRACAAKDHTGHQQFLNVCRGCGAQVEMQHPLR